MFKLNKKKTGILGAIGVVIALAVMFSVAQPMSKTKATDIGGTGGSHGGVSSGGTSATTSQFSSISTIGYSK